MSDNQVTDTVTEEVVVPSPEVVSKEAYDKVKDDMHKYKAELAEMRKHIDDMKVQGHKAKEDWKSVAELHEAKAKDLETRYTGLKESLVKEKKLHALVTEAQKQGINPASLPDLELLDFDEMSIETTSTGKILTSGQDKAIARLKTLRPHWFNKTTPSINPATPELGRPSGSVVTVADLNTAEANYKKTRSESDKIAYFELIQKYKAQGG